MIYVGGDSRMFCCKVAVVYSIVEVVGNSIREEVLPWYMCSLLCLLENNWKIDWVRVFGFVGSVGWLC